MKRSLDRGLGHLVVETLHPKRHLVGERPGDDEQIARARARARGGAESLEVGPRASGLHQLDGATGQPEEHVPDAVRTAPVEEPVDHLVDVGGDHAPAIVGVLGVQPLRRGHQVEVRRHHSPPSASPTRAAAAAGATTGGATAGLVRLVTFGTPRGSPLMERIHSRSPLAQT